MSLRLTRHNGRSGRNGTYNPRHNDRRFDVEHSEHIDAEKTRHNIYWDCFNGLSVLKDREDPENSDVAVWSFAEVERQFYKQQYSAHIEAQNVRNEKTRHTERNRTVDDLLANKKTAPEETIYQIGTIEESASAETLVTIVHEFHLEFEERFGEHVHILDWALHLDEGTPHIHERHVFDCENRYGELCPQQEKALELLGIPLPDESKPKGQRNNRKMMFDEICRAMLFEIAKRHGLQLEEEPSYGGRSYLEKQDFILMNQHQKIAEQELVLEKNEQRLEEITLHIEDAESLINEVTELAYDKAVETVTDVVRAQTQLEDIRIVDDYQKWSESPQRNYSPAEKKLIGKVLNKVKALIRNASQKVMRRVQDILLQPEVRVRATDQIREQARESVLAQLRKHQDEQTKESLASANLRSGKEDQRHDCI